MIYAYVNDYDEKEYPCVYFIRDGVGNIKIGVTKNIEQRINDLQVANPFDLEYFYGMKFPRMNIARHAESFMHWKFETEHIRGEWFREEKVLDYLCNGNIEVCGYKFQNIDGYKKPLSSSQKELKCKLKNLEWLKEAAKKAKEIQEEAIGCDET